MLSNWKHVSLSDLKSWLLIIPKNFSSGSSFKFRVLKLLKVLEFNFFHNNLKPSSVSIKFSKHGILVLSFLQLWRSTNRMLFNCLRALLKNSAWYGFSVHGIRFNFLSPWLSSFSPSVMPFIIFRMNAICTPSAGIFLSPMPVSKVAAKREIDYKG